VNSSPTFYSRVWFGPLEPGWFNFFDTASRRFAVFWPMVLFFSITGSAFVTFCVLICWLLSGHFAEKWRIIRSNPVALASLGMWLLSLVGCLYTTANQADMLKSLQNASNFFILAMCITLFDKALYRDAAIAIFHLGAPFLLGIKIFLIAKYGIESETVSTIIIDYVTLGIIVITWILLIMYRPFSWNSPWSADKTASTPEIGAADVASIATEHSPDRPKSKWGIVPRLFLVLSLIPYFWSRTRGERSICASRPCWR